MRPEEPHWKIEELLEDPSPSLPNPHAIMSILIEVRATLAS